jgi:hypothetical protein
VNAERSAEIRSTAFFLSIVLRTLSLLILIGTAIASYEVARTGDTLLGVPAANDPGTWVVAFTGATLSAMLYGIGSALALLCAIYDRQRSPGGEEIPLHDAIRSETPATSHEASSTSGVAKSDDERIVIAGHNFGPMSTDNSKKTYRPGSLMDHLTRERHIFRDRTD